VYIHMNNRKLAPGAVKCMFFGYASESKGYRMWCPEPKKVIQSRDVTFNETTILSSGTDSVVSSTSVGDQEDTGNSMEIEVETVIAQDGALISLTWRLRLLNLALSVLISLRWRLLTLYLMIVLRGR